MMAYMNYYAPYQNQYASQMQVPQMMNPQQTNPGGLNWIQGEQAAKSYLVAPNSTVLLMDSEAPRFYLKSSDVSGMPMLRMFEYKEIIQGEKDTKAMDMSGFATKAELDALRDEIQGIMKNVPKQITRRSAKEGEADAESAI